MRGFSCVVRMQARLRMGDLQRRSKRRNYFEKHARKFPFWLGRFRHLRLLCTHAVRKHDPFKSFFRLSSEPGRRRTPKILGDFPHLGDKGRDACR